MFFNLSTYMAKLCGVFLKRPLWSGLAPAVMLLASPSSSQAIRKLKWVVGDLNSQPSSAWGDVNVHVQSVRPVFQPPGQDVLESRKLLQCPLLKLSCLTIYSYIHLIFWWITKKEVESPVSHQSNKQLPTVSMTLNWLIQAFSFCLFSYHCFSSMNLSILSYK